MTLTTTVDAIALIQIQSLCLDLSQAMLHQPLPLREGRPNQVNWHRCNKKGKTGYEALTTCETDDTASVLQNFASSCEAVTHEVAGLSISQITAKEFKYHRTCYRDLTRSN